MTDKLHDMSPPIDMTRRRETGPVRRTRPLYVELTPPCNSICPAGEDIVGWLGLAQAGRERAAWEHLVRDNPFPSIHGRVCYHPCETACNRTALDSAVSIHAVERHIGDRARAEGWALPPGAPASGKRVLVVGAGPCGLSAAFHLARLGHEVEVHEAGALPGGMLEYGIPAYRLPRDVLAQEIAAIAALGVRFVFNHRVEDVLAEEAAGRFDAVFVAIGTQAGRHIDIPARDAAQVVSAIGLLHDVAAAQAGEARMPKLGRRVVIYGAGDTAMDAARTAQRLGADSPLILFFSDRAHMEAHVAEAAEAESEGVKIKWLSSIREIGATALRVEIMALDAQGVPQPTGKFETLQADSVILALGQQAESAFLARVPGIIIGANGSVVIGPDMMTGHPGIFAGGDLVPGGRTVTTAVGHGKRAARHIDGWIRGHAYIPPARSATVGVADLKLPIYADAAPARAAEIAPAQRRGFAEITANLSAAEARHEAQRCLSCGHCFECDNCFAACPEAAIAKRGPTRGYDIDFALCTGCAVCVEQCPCHAMEMVMEPGA
jgi:NADPH-dependent glutamate synthase beta subunit-like oxidoreductase